MAELGYETPDPDGRRRGGRPPAGVEGIRTRNVALLYLREDASIGLSIVARVQRMLADKDLNLIFARVDSPSSIPQAVRAGNVDGILGYGQFPAAAVTPKLRRIPAVWMMSRTDIGPDPWGDRVRPDHEAIGVLAAHYLRERGHVRLGYADPAEPGLPLYRQRLASFRTAAEESGASVAVFAADVPGDVDARARRLVDLWLADPQRPTGLFVPEDRVTLRVHHHLLRRNVRPGRDVDLISCDHEKELLSLMRPGPPASIDLHRQTIARLAVERLFWRMRNGVTSPSVAITVSPTLPATRDGDGADDGEPAG